MNLDVCRYEYQAALASQIESLKKLGWEIVPQRKAEHKGDPLGTYMGHHANFEPAIYMRRLIND